MFIYFLPIHFLPMQHGDFPVRKLWKITRGQSFRNDHSIIRIYQNIISIVLPMFNAQLLYTHSIPILLDIYIYIYPLFTHYIYICIYIYIPLCIQQPSMLNGSPSPPRSVRLRHPKRAAVHGVIHGLRGQQPRGEPGDGIVAGQGLAGTKNGGEMGNLCTLW